MRITLPRPIRRLKRPSRRSIVLGLFFLGFVVVLFLTPIHTADAIECSLWNPFSYAKCGVEAAGKSALLIVDLTVSLWATLAWWTARAAAAFFTFIVYRLNGEVGFIDNVIVQAGWAVVRDVANWFFIIFLLVAAIGTILDLANYNVRKILPRLIAVAILINFSLFIGGFIINISNGIAEIFIREVAGVHENLGLAFINSAGLGGLSVPNPNFAGLFTASLGDMAQELARKVVAIVFLFIFAVALGWVALMLVYRIVILWVLLILSPLAFLAAVIPKTQQYWTRWVNDIVRWSVLLPVTAFFIWLSMYLFLFLDENVAFVDSFTLEGGWSTTILDVTNVLLSYILVLTFILLMVKTSKKLAGEAAAFATKILQVGAMVALAPVAAGAGLALKGAMASKAAGAATKAVGKQGQRLRKSPLGQTRAGRAVARTMMGVPEQQQTWLRGEAETGLKDRASMLADFHAEKQPITRHKSAELLAQQHPAYFQRKVNDEDLQKLQETEKTNDLGYTFQKRAPHLIKDKDERDDIMKRITPKDYENLHESVYTSPTPEAEETRRYIMRNANAGQVTASARNMSGEGIGALNATIGRLVDVDSSLAAGLRRLPAAQALGIVSVHQAEIVREGGGIERAGQGPLSAEDRREHGRQMSGDRG